MNDVTKDLLEALRFLLSAHGEQLDLAFAQAHDAIARAEAALAEEVRAYVQAVPDHCDRITWRGSYYNLPIPSKATAPQPDADGWIPWAGGECPVDSKDWVEAKLRDGKAWISEEGQPGEEWLWDHDGGADDIIAYRIVRK